MRRVATTCLPATLLLVFAIADAQAQAEARLVDLQKIHTCGQQVQSTDLIHFGNEWFCVVRKGAQPYSSDGALHVLASAGGEAWNSVAVLRSPTANRGLSKPNFLISQKGELLLAAMGARLIETPKATYHNRQWMSWRSKNGREWGKAIDQGAPDYFVSAVAQHKGTSYSYGVGCICGIAQTTQIRASATGKRFDERYEETFTGFFPGQASLVFADDTGYCLMSRRGEGLLGTSKPPFTDWQWTSMERRICYPNAIRLPGKRVVASVGFGAAADGTDLCWFDGATGKLTEFLKLPTGKPVDVGLATHDGNLWVSYHRAGKETGDVYFAKVVLPR